MALRKTLVVCYENSPKFANSVSGFQTAINLSDRYKTRH